jgi:hypothetical protein
MEPPRLRRNPEGIINTTPSDGEKNQHASLLPKVVVRKRGKVSKGSAILRKIKVCVSLFFIGGHNTNHNQTRTFIIVLLLVCTGCMLLVSQGLGDNNHNIMRKWSKGHDVPRIVQWVGTDVIELTNATNPHVKNEGWKRANRPFASEHFNEQTTKTKKKKKKKKIVEHDQFETTTCKAMHDWQKQVFPACNTVHEIDMSQTNADDGLEIRLVGHGGFRDVWMVQDADGVKRVLKTLVQSKDFTHREYDRHRRDATTMSLLTSSKRIPNIYGYCTNSGIFDFAPGGSLEDHIFRQKEKWSSKQKLLYSWQAAAALADVHTLGMKNDHAAVAHTDITTDQFLWMDGMYKLNDFNRARYLRWNYWIKSPCKFYVGKNPGRHRSPEEYKYDDLDEKIDVFSLGNVLYSILTGLEVFADVRKKDEAMQMVKEGKRSPLPSPHDLEEGEDIIVKVIEMCWKQQPSKRPTVQKVASLLNEKLKELNIEH